MGTGDNSKMLIYSRGQRIHGWHVVALSESRVLNGADRHQPAVPEQSVCAAQKHHKILKKATLPYGKIVQNWSYGIRKGYTLDSMPGFLKGGVIYEEQDG
jgi:hypothetical protein